jgi:DNA-binding transcriptional MerR regulator
MHIELSKDKRYYSIGEVAKAFDVNASLIRFWDSEFDILKPKKNAKGNRMFTPEDVKNLQLIYHARRCQNPFEGRTKENFG